MDYLLCGEKRKRNLPGTKSVPASPVCFKVKDDAVYHGDAYRAFYDLVSGMFGSVDVHGLAESGFGNEIPV